MVLPLIGRWDIIVVDHLPNVYLDPSAQVRNWDIIGSALEGVLGIFTYGLHGMEHPCQ